jgi:hypothetical protein
MVNTQGLTIHRHNYENVISDVWKTMYMYSSKKLVTDTHLLSFFFSHKSRKFLDISRHIKQDYLPLPLLPIVTVCVFVRHLFSWYPFYFDFHSARIIFEVSSGFYLWNINNTKADICNK